MKITILSPSPHLIYSTIVDTTVIPPSKSYPTLFNLMSESIQFRGPLEVEGPGNISKYIDDLDDDDNYMKPGLETAGLKNRQ